MDVLCYYAVAILVVCVWSEVLLVQGMSTQCTNLLPGVSSMARGVDSSRFDLTPLDHSVDDGIRDEVVAFTCRRGKTAMGSDGIETFQVPDQTRILTSMPGNLTTSSTIRLFRTIDDVINWIRTNDGGYDDIFDYAFTDSGSFRKIEDGFLNRGFKIVADVSAHTSATRVSLHLPWALRLTTKANDFLSVNVTGDYETNAQGYDDFIHVFGTHFLESLDFGGYVQSIIGIGNDTYLQTHSEDDVKRNAKALFYGIVFNPTNQGGLDVPSKDFTDSSDVFTQYYGGNTTLLKMGLLDEWRNSLAEKPQMFHSVLKPIYDLIRDSKKKENMKKAVGMHLIRSYGHDLKRRVRRLESKIGVTEITRINKTIDELLVKSVNPLVLGKELKAKVDEEILVPEWFRSNTSLCLQTDSVTNKLCDQSQHQCSPPNQNLRQVATKADSSVWGCALQWGITSFDYPSWFEDVQICFRNRATGDQSTACAGTSAQDMCAQVNAFTPSFATVLVNGSCDASWTIDTPTSAPAWMKTVQLCYHWHPRHKGRCSKVATTRCARVNQWTPYHTLTSDDGAVCGMSWSMKSNMV